MYQLQAACGSRSNPAPGSGSVVQGRLLRSQHSPENAARERSRVRNLRQAFHSLQVLPPLPCSTGTGFLQNHLLFVIFKSILIKQAPFLELITFTPKNESKHCGDTLSGDGYKRFPRPQTSQTSVCQEC